MLVQRPSENRPGLPSAGDDDKSVRDGNKSLGLRQTEWWFLVFEHKNSSDVQVWTEEEHATPTLRLAIV